MINPKEQFQWKKVDGKLHWVVPESLEYLKGHFPGMPIVPGVAFLDLTLEAIKEHEGESNLEISNITSAKFLKPLSPGETIILSLEKVSDSWHARWSTPSETVADIKLSVFRT